MTASKRDAAKTEGGVGTHVGEALENAGRREPTEAEIESMKQAARNAQG